MGFFPCRQLLQSLEFMYVIRLTAWNLYSLTVHLSHILTDEGPLVRKRRGHDRLPGRQYGKPFLVHW